MSVAEDSASTKACVFCGKAIPTGAVRCEHCKGDQAWTDRCRSCGNAMSPQAVRCPACAAFQLRGGAQDAEKGRCVACHEPLPIGARVCIRCHSPQVFGGRLILSQATLALIVSLVSLLAVVGPPLVKLLHDPDPQLLFVRFGDSGSETGEIHLLLRNPTEEQVLVSGGRLSGLDRVGWSRTLDLGVGEVADGKTVLTPGVTVDSGRAKPVVLYTAGTDVPCTVWKQLDDDIRGFRPLLEVRIAGEDGTSLVELEEVDDDALRSYLRSVLTTKAPCDDEVP